MHFTNTRFFKITVTLFFIILFIFGLIKAAAFLQPLAMAFLLSFLLIPISRWLEQRGMSRGFASFLSTMVAVAFLATIVGLITFQANQMSENWDQLKDRGEKRLENIEEYVINQTGITQQQIDDFLKNTGSDQIKDLAKSISLKTINSVTDILLMFIYTLLILFYRKKFRVFITKLTQKSETEEAKQAMHESAEAARNYLRAKFMLIGILAIIYSIGLSLLGIKYGIFYGVLAALLTIIPYIGNMIGAFFPLMMAIIYNDTTTALLVVALFTITQFIESYILEPLLVKKEVDLNPFFSIAAAILGGIIWDVPGMIIAIPYLAIFYIITCHIKPLEPITYLLSNKDC